jgi:hypothetical protein
MSLPFTILWNVRVSLTRKFQLAALFSLVIITMVISIVRVAVVSNKNNLSNSRQVENTWLYLWHFVESAVGKQLVRATSQPLLINFHSLARRLSCFFSYSIHG